ncbi:MAG: hypothetical protein U0446_10455 [Dehalococcoidia bacterium]
MTELFYTTALSRHASGLGWSTRTARFEYAPVQANIQLSYYDAQNGERFEPFQPRFARTWIETPMTPTTVVAGMTIPMPNVLKDSTVWLTTDRLTFQLQTENVTAVAVGMIWDRRPDLGRWGRASRLTAGVTLDLAIHDEAGNVIGTHQEVQLEGGRPIDPEEVQARVLDRAQATSNARLSAAIVDLSQLPEDASFRIDTSSGRAFPLETE